MVYQWNRAARTKTDAQQVGEFFEKLEATGGLTPKRIVDESREETALLHKEFEWDDSIAAEAYREQQARVLICMIQIAPDEKPEAQPVRAFFNVQYGSKQYESTQTILADAEKSDALFDIALRELLALKKKYAGISALSNVFKEIDAAAS